MKLLHPLLRSRVARLLSNVVRTQIDIHKVYGGVVPEVAARSHIEVILPVIDEALAPAGLSSGSRWDGVTYAPGLVGSLFGWDAGGADARICKTEATLSGAPR